MAKRLHQKSECNGYSSTIDMCLNCKRSRCTFDGRENYIKPPEDKKVWIIRKVRRKMSTGNLTVSYFLRFEKSKDSEYVRYVTAIADVTKAKIFRSYDEANTICEECKRLTCVNSSYEVIERRKEYERCGINKGK